MRHVFSMETEREKDLQTLAETIVLCQLKREKGSCARSSCQACATYAELEMCLRELPACDNLRVKNMAQALYELKAFQYGHDDRKPFKEKAIECLKIAGIVVGGIVGISVGAILFFRMAFWLFYILVCCLGG